MKKYALVLTMALSLSACGPSSHKAPGGGGANDNGKQEGGANPQPGDPLNFVTMNAKLFTPKCGGCHSSFTGYQKVKENLVAIQGDIEANRMPKNGPPLSDDLKLMLAQWIEAGAPE